MIGFAFHVIFDIFLLYISLDNSYDINGICGIVVLDGLYVYTVFIHDVYDMLDSIKL
jgi:hypothetical protein